MAGFTLLFVYYNSQHDTLLQYSHAYYFIDLLRRLRMRRYEYSHNISQQNNTRFHTFSFLPTNAILLVPSRVISAISLPYYLEVTSSAGVATSRARHYRDIISERLISQK